MIVLDTDLVTHVLRRSSEISERLLSRIDEAIQRQVKVVTTIITYEEQFKGWLKLLSHARNLQDEIEAYRRLRVHLDDFKQLKIADFDELAAVQLQRLRKMKIRIGTMDLKIAAITLANDAMLWTRNVADFRKLPGLRIDDATL